MDLSSIYCVEFSDDALAPKFPKGTRAFFRPANHAQDRSVVVVEKDGQRHVRYLKACSNGAQSAAALNSAFMDLREFRIEAVMCMVQQCSI